jgi:hypothetical protein
LYLPERDLILYLLTDENYKEYFSFIDLNHIRDNYRELHYVYLAIKTLHEKYPDRDHTLEGLQTFFFVQYPDADKDLYVGLFKTLQEAVVDTTLGVGILKQIKRRQQALKLSEEAVKFATGYSDFEKLSEKVKILTEVETHDLTDDVESVSDDLEALV